MTIKVSTLLSHDTVVQTDTAPILGGPLNTDNFPIENGPNPVTITNNEYPISTGLTGQVLTTNGFGVLYWSTIGAGSGTVTSVGAASVGPYSSALTVSGSPVTTTGTIDFELNLFTSTEPGIVPMSGGGTTNFLRADGTWALPPGGGGSASNILGGLANEILYQTAPNTTSFITAPSVPNTFLEWNGSAFVWTAGSGSGTVTSVGLTSSASTITVTGFPNPITTSGSFNIDLPLTGVTANSYGSASSVATFTVDSRGRLTLASTVPISITPAQAGLGSVTNALQVINAGGAPSIQEASGAPSGVPTYGTGALYVDQSITNGNSIYYYNGSIWVALAQSLKLYQESWTPGYTPPSAGGTNSVAIGEGATTVALDSLALGNQSLARLQGGVVQASGRFAGTGDAQSGRYLVRSTTTNNVPTELFINGTAGGIRLVLTDDTTWTFKVMVTGHRTNGSDGHAGFTAAGVIYRNSGAATTSLQGSPEITILSRSNPTWTINISADNINGSLKITVTGEPLKIIRWLALVETVEVTN